MIGDAPEDYSLSERDELAPLVRDFHELVGRNLTDAELLALDFALEWTFEWAEAEYEQTIRKELGNLAPQYGVTYGMLPNVKLLEVASLEVAQKIASALNGQIRTRSVGKWELWKGTE